MSANTTDGLRTIDNLPPQMALAKMLASQLSAAQTIAAALPQIEAAAKQMAFTISSGRCVIYAAAGSSGLMALSDACELSGTFRIPTAQIRIAMAGGVPTDGQMSGATEDDTIGAKEVAADIVAGDLALILSASGNTPYALAMAEAAKARGACVVAIANVSNSALLKLAEIAICLPTEAEVVDGSTRLGAGTAQKITLNMISTMAGILLGHVHNGLMVNLNPDNIKLRKRAESIVANITGNTEEEARAALQEAGYETKLAVLLAAGSTKEAAKALLSDHSNHLGPCLAALSLPD